MPIPTTPAAAGPYNTDGVTTSFAFAYKSFGVAYHAVVKDTSGVQEQLVYGVDFSVTQNADQENNPGGNVLISPALPVGSTLTIYSNVPYDQPLDLPLAGSFSSAGIRDALDRIVTLLKQSNLATSGGTLLPSDRSVRVPSGEAIADLPIAASRANKFLLFDAGGDVAVVNLGDLALLLTGGTLTGPLDIEDSLTVDDSIEAALGPVGVPNGRIWEGGALVGAGTITTKIPYGTSARGGGGLLVVSGADIGGQSFCALYNVRTKLPGGAGNVGSTLLSRTGAGGSETNPPLTIGATGGSDGFVTVTVGATSVNITYVCGIGF